MGIEVPGLDGEHIEPDVDGSNLDEELYALEDEHDEQMALGIHALASLAIAALYVNKIGEKKTVPQDGVQMDFTAVQEIPEGANGYISFTMAQFSQILFNFSRQIGSYLADMGHGVEVASTYDRINQMHQRGEIK